MKLNHFILILATVLASSVFHNCAQNASFVSQESLPKIVKNLETQEIGTGGGYLGKPLEGDYIRTYPDFKCDSVPADQGVLSVTANVHIVKDNCKDTNIKFNFSESVLDFSRHNRDYLGVGTAIYEIKKQGVVELPTEVWCQFDSDKIKFDVAVKVDSTLKDAQAKIFVDLAGVHRTTVPLPVTRTLNNTFLTFSSEGVNLQVQKAALSNQFSNGHVRMMLDNTIHEQDVICRVANLAPIDEMNTSLSNMNALNSFTTDGQEATCDHASILACDNLEDRVSQADLTRAKYVNRGWIFQPGNYLISNNSYDGARALEMPNILNGSGSGNIGFPFSASVPEVYVRFYINWTANFVFSPTSTALLKIYGSSPLAPTFAFSGSRALYMSNNLGFYNSTFQPNVNQWYCFEAFVKSATTPAANDGVIKFWVNGTNILDVANQTGDGALSEWIHYGNWSCTDSNNDNVCDSQTHPAQSVFLDNVVVAKQRIGCL